MLKNWLKLIHTYFCSSIKISVINCSSIKESNFCLLILFCSFAATTHHLPHAHTGVELMVCVHLLPYQVL